MMIRKTLRWAADWVGRRDRLRADPRRISVAIPTYNRADRVLAVVLELLCDPRVAEIVVRDDASDDEDGEALAEGLKPFAPRVRLFRNEANLGAFANKLAVVADCRSRWAVLLDSDNRLGAEYLDSFFALPAWSERVIYCPQRARPRFDFTWLAGATLDEGAMPDVFTLERNESMCVFLNTGNYLVPVQPYVRCLGPYAERRVAAADVCFANMIWLHAGGVLYVVPGMEYDHDVHDGSWFKTTAATSKPLAREMRDALASGDTERVSKLLTTMGRS